MNFSDNDDVVVVVVVKLLVGSRNCLLLACMSLKASSLPSRVFSLVQQLGGLAEREVTGADSIRLD